eukprot:4741051-Pyramimonas_sp.AAC.1
MRCLRKIGAELNSPVVSWLDKVSRYTQLEADPAGNPAAAELLAASFLPQAAQAWLGDQHSKETPSATKRPESAAPSRGKHLHQPEHLAAGRAGKHLAGQRAQLPGGDGAHTLHGQRYAQGGILGAFRPAPPALGERLAPPHNSGDFWPVKQIRTNHTRAVPTRDQ